MRPTTYIFRNGVKLIDHSGTLAGTIAVVYMRQEYGEFREAQTIVDVGANMGCFAVYAATICPEAVIHCYEPEDTNGACLKRNIVNNSLQHRVHVHQVAVAKQSGVRMMAIKESPMHFLEDHGENGTLHKAVQCTTLAAIMENQNFNTVDLLKMNCEGAEYEILQGCKQAEYARIQQIRLEYHNLGGEKNGHSLARLLESRDYTIQRFTTYRDESGFIWARQRDMKGT